MATSVLRPKNISGRSKEFQLYPKCSQAITSTAFVSTKYCRINKLQNTYVAVFSFHSSSAVNLQDGHLFLVKIAFSEKLTFSVCNEKDRVEIGEMEQWSIGDYTYVCYFVTFGIGTSFLF